MQVVPLATTLTQRLPAAPSVTAKPDAAALQGWAAVGSGLRRSLPVMLGYVPLGFTFGVVALSNGLSAGQTLLMSALVFAASSQLLAVQLLANGAPLLSVLATTLICNLRHLLMSAALAPHVRRFSRLQTLLFGFGLCDEAFALHAAQWAQRPVAPLEALTVNGSLQLALVGGTALALVVPLGPLDLEQYGLDYAPVAMFIAMLVLLIGDRLQLGMALLAAGLAVLWHSSWSMLLATLLTASLGTAWQLRRRHA